MVVFIHGFDSPADVLSVVPTLALTEEWNALTEEWNDEYEEIGARMAETGACDRSLGGFGHRS